MLRARLSEASKAAMKSKDSRRVSTLRLILAALKDRDIAARADGNNEGLSDEQIISMLGTMVRQRGESITLYEGSGRPDLAQQEREEIAVIEDFMPVKLGDEEVSRAIHDLVAELGAVGLKDMGRTMAAMKARYAGRLDFAKASGIVKQLLTGTDGH